MRTYLPVASNEVAELGRRAAVGEIDLEIRPMPEDDFRATEMAWLHHNQQKLAQFAGQWLAIDGPDLIAHSFDLPGLLRAAAKAGHPHPFVTAVPGEPIKVFYGWQS